MLDPGLLEATRCLELPCELDGDRVAERGVALDQAVERGARNLEQLRVADRVRTRGARRPGQERELAEGRSRAELTHRPLLALSHDDDP